MELGPLKPAAVLVGIVNRPDPAILLTRRSAKLRQHAGQVSFPGGRMDAADASPEAAALREAQEEIGLDPGLVEILGRLNDYDVLSGYRITPVLGFVDPRFVPRPSPQEVEAVFELTMDVLLDPGAPVRRSAIIRDKTRHFWVWPHAKHEIWGATAAILVHLARRLRGEL